MLDVKVGDRVRLMHTNGDTAEVTVALVDRSTRGQFEGIQAESNYFDRAHWSVAEIVPKPAPSEPTGLGAVVEYLWDSEGRTIVAVKIPGDKWLDTDGDRYTWHGLVSDSAVPGTIKVLSSGYVAAG